MEQVLITTGEPLQTNIIYRGDCAKVMPTHVPAESVDLIYVDPPFFSERQYEVLWGNGYELRAFEDRWKGGIENYISWMEPKVRECHRALKPTGSLYIHCDGHANHRLRTLLDQIFGEAGFKNEIVWKRSDAHSDAKQGAKHYGRIHDTILFYTKSEDYTFNTQYLELPGSTADKWYKHVEPKTGRRYNMADLTAAKPGGDTRYLFHGKRPPKGRYWAYSKEKMAELEREGRIVYSTSGRPYMKRYLDESRGVPLQDWWDDISMLRGINRGGERLGYPTQKPEALLDRIIKVSSNTGDLVLDPMCGCGTAIAAAHKLGRSWIGIDISPTACKLMADRMRKLRVSKVEILGMPKTLEEVKSLEPFEFQNWVCEKLLAHPSERKVGDKGIDGWLLDGRPLQVKQSEGVSRPIVDNFETAMKRVRKPRGLIVALSFSKGAHEEVARAKNQEGLEIELRTVKEIIEED